MGNLNVFSTKKDNTISNEVLQNYYQGFAIDRMKIRYLLLRKKITMLALDSCIEDYEKEGLNEREMEYIGHLIGNTLKSKDDKDKLNYIAEEVKKIAIRYPMFSDEWVVSD